MTTTYDIEGSNGDTAEAIDLASALVAARTLVDDGSDSARVTDPVNRWVATARRVNGNVGIHMIQGVKVS